MTGSQPDTRPDVPLRMELTFEVPGAPEQVWQAIATGEGISSWFLPTDVEEGEGGAIVTHMGPDASSPGTVTGWDPPRRFAYEEPEWAALVGHEGAPVTPLATEFLVEARSGGTCVVRVVSSAFGTGADWEQEFFSGMEKAWAPWFDVLRLYVASFPGQRATRLGAAADVAGSGDEVNAAMRRALGVTEAGQPVETGTLTARVERIADMMVLLSLTAPLPGYLALYAYDKGDGVAAAQVAGYLFSEEAEEHVAREERAWKAWLEALRVPTTTG
ncbi:MAG TPA: SRPBCC domain-containing protein [Acidimicrobiales bacterium]|nr:SRPBCC domain-containing protein [Acidimicrobiales bacterium]